MKSILLTPDGDLDLSAGLQLIDGPQRVAQHLRQRLRTFLGEWEFDLDAGVPWYQNILGRKVQNLNEVDQILRAQILSVEGVSGILEFSMALDPEYRSLQIAGKVSTEFGTVQLEGNFP